MLYQARVNTVNPLSLNIWNDTLKSVSLKKVPDNAIVDVIQEYTPVWAVVEYGGVRGYVDREYLVKIAPPVVEPEIALELEKKAAELVRIAGELKALAIKLRG